jgi:TonB family protein
MKLRCPLILALTFLTMASAVAGIHAAQKPQASVNDPIILSDTHGYNFTPYLNQLTNKVRFKWYSAIPDEAAWQGQKGRVVLIFTVLRNGAIQNLHIVANSGTQSLDQAATTAVQSASPFAQLPTGFSGDQIVVQFALTPRSSFLTKVAVAYGRHDALGERRVQGSN